MMFRYRCLILFFLGMKWWAPVFAQSPLLPEYNQEFHMMQRWIIKGKTPRTPPGFSHEIERISLYSTLDTFAHRDTSADDTRPEILSRDTSYLQREIASLSRYTATAPIQPKKKGWRSYFYPYPTALFHKESDTYYFQLNPILRLSGGQYKEHASSRSILENTRGFEVEGAFDHRFFFYSRILETQRHLLPNEMNFLNTYHAIPHEGSFKPFESRYSPGSKGVDFNGSIGYFGIQVSPSLQVKIGQGRHFIGSGYRSLLLSDFGKDYFYGQMDWRLGPLFYRNIYSSMVARTHQDLNKDALLPKKYMAAHVLGLNLPYGIQIALYEAVIHTRNNRFELSYLNPIIFYKSLEFNLGSPDNVLIGGDARWDVAHRFNLYGQLVIDEFNLTYLKQYQRGWWANKFGIQLGAFYPDALGIRHLDLRIEYNFVRPYTYSHRDSIRSYAHYNQPLAHPWGANFKELITSIRYQPSHHWNLDLSWISGCRGLDKSGENNGSNILISHLYHVTPFGNFVCQGELHQINWLSFNLSYMFLHHYYLDMKWLRRYEMVEDRPGVSDGFTYLSIGIRANIAMNSFNF